MAGKAKSLIHSPDRTRYISAVTALEITMKVRIGKVDFTREIADNFEAILVAGAFQKLDITSAHALLAGRLSGDHKDPFDRLLASQCRIEGIALITIDPRVPSFRRRRHLVAADPTPPLRLSSSGAAPAAPSGTAPYRSAFP
ncbi:type II toxin-antitoxin system VapC family toxin [Pararhizobium sp.]|uniref:type II toxin-antitoxin system VapC family toxin n=1 Tax=Pararhizobium sp. TaxID=1977563 RepID=UPI003FA69D6B